MNNAAFEKWLDEVLDVDFPDGIAGIAFNLYDDGDDMWSIEAVGAGTFDEMDDDWACDEVTTFDTRDEPFSWEESCEWEDILEQAVEALCSYLEKGKFADKLKAYKGVGVGFVDGDITVIYINDEDDE